MYFQKTDPLLWVCKAVKSWMYHKPKNILLVLTPECLLKHMHVDCFFWLYEDAWHCCTDTDIITDTDTDITEHILKTNVNLYCHLYSHFPCMTVVYYNDYKYWNKTRWCMWTFYYNESNAAAKGERDISYNMYDSSSFIWNSSAPSSPMNPRERRVVQSGLTDFIHKIVASLQKRRSAEAVWISALVNYSRTI